MLEALKGALKKKQVNDLQVALLTPSSGPRRISNFDGHGA
jgi:hypothetical protein